MLTHFDIEQNAKDREAARQAARERMRPRFQVQIAGAPHDIRLQGSKEECELFARHANRTFEWMNKPERFEVKEILYATHN